MINAIKYTGNYSAFIQNYFWKGKASITEDIAPFDKI